MKTMVVTNARVFRNGQFHQESLTVKDGIIAADMGGVFSCAQAAGGSVFSFPDCVIFPGFTDVHVHFREPGFSYKETILQGSMAAARGGYTAVCTMPNLSPTPDSVAHLAQQKALIDRDAVIHVYPYGCITVGSLGKQLSDMAGMAADAVAFSDDGKGVQSDAMMEAAMQEAKRLGKIIAAHCEDEQYSTGVVHAGQYARDHKIPTRTSEDEWRQLARDLNLVAKTGCAYHVCHVSCKESVELLRQAKASGLDVTAETAPHYLILTDEDMWGDARMKMAPPLRSRADRDAMVEALCDGTVDMIATDHAPHSTEEKMRGLVRAPMGVVGLECAFPVLYTELVLQGALSLETLIDRMAVAPRRRFGIGGGTDMGQSADFTVFDLHTKTRVNAHEFVSKGHITPFHGRQVHAQCLMTVVGGRVVYSHKN